MWLIGAAILAVVIAGFITTLASGIYTGKDWLNLTVYGLAQGGIYALIALGYTMVYGILRMINFAHGDIFMTGPYIAYFLAVAFDQSGFLNRSPIIALGILTIISMAVATGLAVLLERIAYRPLRRAPRLVPLITAIGASFFIEYAFLGLFGSGIKGFPTPEQLKGTINILGLQILKTQALVIVAAIVMMAVLYLFIRRTKTGKAMQAVSEDKDAAALMGIDVDRIIVMTFIVGGALAGVAGILYVLMFRQIYFFSGFIPGLKAFTAAVLGGIGNVVGAMLGGMFLGIAESLFPNVLGGLGIPAPYQLKDALAFLLLILVLIFRPTGILGERLEAKKA